MEEQPLFTAMTGHEALDALAQMSLRKRRKTAQRLIYKKGQRPADLADQIVLLTALREDHALSDFDKLYALIAGAHKACEAVLYEDARRWLGYLLDAEQMIRDMPIGYGLRKDRTHLVFSALNVAMNLDLLTGSENSARLRDWFYHELDALNPKRMTPYLFNSTSNVVKCAGLAILSRPEGAIRTASLMRRLLSYSIEINNPVHWWVFSRFQSSARLEDVSERAAFGSFCNSMKRLDAMEAVAKSTGAEDTREALRKVAGLCVAQANSDQKAALLEQAEHILST